jgi:hypothetical protein
VSVPLSKSPFSTVAAWAGLANASAAIRSARTKVASAFTGHAFNRALLDIFIEAADNNAVLSGKAARRTRAPTGYLLACMLILSVR